MQYLVGVGVEEVLFLVGAEQRVRVLLQRLRPRLEALAADVEPDAFVGRRRRSVNEFHRRRRRRVVAAADSRRRRRRRRPTPSQVHG